MNEKKYLDEVRNYYDTYAETIKDSFSDTYQAYCLQKEDAGEGYRSTNVFLASRMGIKPGDRLLDAGCGAGGPAVDIANHICGITIDAITISPVQARLASELVKENNLSDRIRVHIGDFHELPFAPESFNGVYFFESDCYSCNQKKLFAEVYRVLKPGGFLYIKGIYAKEGPLSDQEKADNDKLCSMFVWKGTTLSAAEKAVAEAGFVDIRTARLENMYSSIFFRDRKKACLTEVNGILSLTPFGRRHYDFFQTIPWFSAEIHAIKP